LVRGTVVVRKVAFAVPGDLATPTGGYAYDRRMIAELEHLGWTVDVINLGEGFPRPSSETRAFAEQRLASVSEGQPIVIDGLAYGVLPETAARLRLRHLLIAMVHHPLALETGLTPAEAAALEVSEQKALAAAAAVIASSENTARELIAAYGVPADRITVAPPGTDRAPAARGSSDGIVRLFSVGSIVPRKGYDLLIAALAQLVDLPWHLTIAGDRTRDPAAAARLDADIRGRGLEDRVAVLGAVPEERLAVLYAASDLFVLASRFEGYGMAYAEAIVRGLPVIGTAAGAIPETVPLGAGILVPPDDVAALVRALRRLIESPDERRRFAAAARGAAERLPTWPDSAKLFARALEAAA
jgi:glycosyltransferase involved in cell wall biosynthesis